MVLRCIRSYSGEKEVNGISFDLNSEGPKKDYLDIFEGVTSDVTYTAKYDENSDTGTTYLETSKMRRHDELKTEHKVQIMDCSLYLWLAVG